MSSSGGSAPVSSDDIGHQLTIAVVIWIVVLFICVLLRFIGRRVTDAGFGVDDYLVALSLGSFLLRRVIVELPILTAHKYAGLALPFPSLLRTWKPNESHMPTERHDSSQLW